MLRRAAYVAMVGGAIVAIATCRPSTREPEPTAEELERLAASEDGDRARDHRREAQALRDEEARACAGIDPEARDASPLADPGVQAVADVYELERYGRSVFRMLRGAEIDVRAERGMTRAWLSRMLACHVARHGTTLLPDRDVDPLAVGRPVISVVESETGFRVTVRGRNDREGAEIGRRARATLAPAR